MKAVPSIFLAFYLTLFVTSSSKCQRLAFNRVPPPTGMHAAVLCGVQDLHGYMWIGTYQSALRRFDGYNYALYANDPQNPNSLAGNWMESLCADSKGFIWIGTLGYGLDRLDPATNNFVHHRSNPNDANSLSNDSVRTILEDRNGRIWVGTQNGLNRFDPKTGKFTQYFNKHNDPSSLSCNRVMKIYEDRQGTIWVGTGSVWLGQGGETSEGGLNRYDEASDKFIRYLHDPADPQSLINNKVKAIFEDSRGTFWVGTAGDGLHTMDRTSGTFQRHLYDPYHPENLSRPPQKRIRPHADDHITFIIEDAVGAIWIGTFGNGLNRYDPDTQRVTHYPNFKDQETGVELEVPWWACVTHDGMLWIGYWRGLYRVDPLPRNIPYFATGRPITQIFEDDSGVLWYGSDEGLVAKDRKTGSERHYVHNTADPHSISNDRIGAIYQDRQGIFWIGTGNGLNRFDPKTGHFSRQLFNPQGDSSLIDHNVGAVYQDRQGSFWFGVDEVGAGLIRKDRKSKNLTHYRHNPEDTTSFSKGEVYRLYEDNSGSLWVGTRGGGLNKFLPESGTFQHFLDKANIHNLWQDTEGIIWVGTSTGLYRSNREMNTFSRFTGPNAELAENIIVNGVLEDDQKVLWVNASIGICRINSERNEVLIFSRHNDPIFYNGTGSHKSRNGELFFGGGSGYFVFFPQQMKSNSKPPQIVLSEFRIGDQRIIPGSKASPLKAPLSQTNEIALQHNQNAFSFDFAGIHYRSPENNRHLFKLENLDNTWRKAGDEKTAYYYNVSPGEYIFRVKAANSDGIWEEKSVAIIISPPWWRTSWAYALYAFAFIGTLYGGWRYLQRQERIKNEQEVRRIKAEQLTEIDRLKSRFFANISHEFRTPLTLILSPLEKLLAQESEHSQHRSLYQMMQRNARRLLNLVNQLLDLSKLEARKMKLETQPGDVIDFLRRITASFASLAEERKINFQVQSPAGSLWTCFDHDKLEKILNNLLSNAFKFTSPSGDVTIALRLKPGSTNPYATKDKAHILAEFSVRDSGIGIAAPMLSRVFDRFHQLDNSLTREQEGTGIGLSLTRELVELHQGTIAVTSELGKGTQFTVSLPLELIHPKQSEMVDKLTEEHHSASNGKPEQRLEPASASADASSQVESITDFPAPLVLIVEDNDDLRRFLRQSLSDDENLACRVIEASNGLEGYQLAMDHIPDLVVSDIMMPKMDGIEFCRLLKRDKKTDHIPVILLTAKASGESRIEGLETGADDYLTKPFEAAELLVRIKNLIEGRKKLRERFSREITLQPASISITSMDEKLLQHVMQIVEEHMSDSNFGVEAFCREAGMSRTQLHRKLKALTDQSAGDFIRIMRLKRAAELLANQVGSIAEVAFMVGFNDPSYFTKCFQKQFGKTPSEFVEASSV